MPTTFYLRSSASSVATASNDLELLDSPGAAVTTGDQVSVVSSSPASGGQIRVPTGGTIASWWSGPLIAQSIPSQAVTGDLWGLESNAMANQSLGWTVHLYSGDGVTNRLGGTTALASAVGTTELGTVATNISSTMANSIVGNALLGDRLRIQIYTVGIPTNGGATGYVTTFQYEAAEGASGDSQIRFTNNITLDAAAATEDPMPYFGGGYYG
jgi:hypothetical protein